MKRNVLLFFCLFLCVIYAYVYSHELGSGSGSSYPATLDVDAVLESTDTYAREDVPNDLAEAIINIQVELGSAPAGGFNDVRGRLDEVAVTTTANKTSITSLGVSTTANKTSITNLEESTGNIAGLEGASAGDSFRYDGSNWVAEPKGSAGQVWAVSGSSGGYTTAAGAGNKNDEVNLEAEQFSTVEPNNAAIYLHQAEITYDGVVSTGAMFTIQLPDSARPNHAFASMNWSRQWDDGTVYIYVTFVTSSTSGGNVNLRVGIGTCTFAGANFEIYDSTTSVGNGWCDQRNATMTITSTNILVDGKHIIVHLGRGSEDTCTQTVYGLNVKFAFAKD